VGEGDAGAAGGGGFGIAMQAKKVAGRQGPGGWSGEMDPETRAAAAAAANALFIFSAFTT
jgi:hypothetical protein